MGHKVYHTEKKMEIAVKNLVKRGNTYYFRSRLPDYYGEIKISLKVFGVFLFCDR